MRLFAFFILLMSFSHSTFAKELVCDEGFDMFEPIRKSAHPWGKFHEYFSKYIPTCDEGYFADGASELTNDLLLKWKDIPGLIAECNKDKKFRDYVISNVNNTEAKDRLRKVQKNAQTKCPKDAKELCGDIEKAAAAAQIDPKKTK
jgi:hypothetical protein